MLAVANQVALHHHVLGVAASDDPGAANGTTDVHHRRYGRSAASHGWCCYDGRCRCRTTTGEEILSVHNQGRHADQLVPDQVLDLGGGHYAVPVRHDGTPNDRISDSVYGVVFDIRTNIPSKHRIQDFVTPGHNNVFIFISVLLQSLAKDDVCFLVDGDRLLHGHSSSSLHVPIRQIPALLDRVSSHIGYFVSNRGNCGVVLFCN